jgi:sugar (pentulose or hexulose) kinase
VTTTDIVVGVDFGTTRIKALAVDREGAVRAVAERPTPWRHHGGRADIDPVTLARLSQTVASEAATTACTEGSPRVVGIGVTGMAETGVLVDGRDRPLAPAIAWHDPRGEVDTIERELGTELFQSTTGMPLSTLPSLSKLLWIRQHVREASAAVRFYSVAEWIVRGLGGDPVAELSLASRTGMFDIGQARPWDAAFSLLDAKPLLPEPVIAGTAAGNAHGEGVPSVLHGATLTVAGHDHQTGAFGVGAATDGALFDSLGTAEALVRTVRPPLTPAQINALVDHGVSVGWGVVSGCLCLLGGLPTGLTLQRIGELVGATTSEARRALGNEALRLPVEGPPMRLVEPTFEGFSLTGIGDGANPAGLWRAAIDSLVVEAERVLGSINALAGPHKHVVIGGGWHHNPALLAAKRRQYGDLRITDIAEPGAFGAALMAATAAGVALPAHQPSPTPTHATTTNSPTIREASAHALHPR